MFEVAEDRSPGAARRKLLALTEEQRKALITKAAAIYGLEESRVADGYLLGIKNIEAETTE